MLSISNLAGFGADDQQASLRYLGSQSSLVDGSQFVFTIDKGRASPNRHLIYAVTIDSVTLGNTTVTGLSVNDAGFKTATATKLVELTSANGALTSIWIVQPETLTFGSGDMPQSCNIDINLSQVMQNCTLHLWEAFNINPVPTATYTDTTGNPSSFNMNVPSHSCAVAALTVDAIGSGTITLTGLTERSDAVRETSVHSCADGVFQAANAALAVSAQHSGAATIHMLCAAVFQSSGGRFFTGGY